MNLIKLFESQPKQDVETFNRIFYTTPIEDVLPYVEVEIGRLTAKGRQINLGNIREIFIHLPVELKQKIRRTQIKRQIVDCKVKLSPLYKLLKSSEFMIYHAIKELGEIHSVVHFAEQISVDRRTVSNAITSLLEKKLIKRNGHTISLAVENA